MKNHNNISIGDACTNAPLVKVNGEVVPDQIGWTMKWLGAGQGRIKLAVRIRIPNLKNVQIEDSSGYKFWQALDVGELQEAQRVYYGYYQPIWDDVKWVQPNQPATFTVDEDGTEPEPVSGNGAAVDFPTKSLFDMQPRYDNSPATPAEIAEMRDYESDGTMRAKINLPVNGSLATMIPPKGETFAENLRAYYGKSEVHTAFEPPVKVTEPLIPLASNAIVYNVEVDIKPMLLALRTSETELRAALNAWAKVGDTNAFCDYLAVTWLARRCGLTTEEIGDLGSRSKLRDTMLHQFVTEGAADEPILNRYGQPADTTQQRMDRATRAYIAKVAREERIKATYEENVGIIATEPWATNKIDDQPRDEHGRWTISETYATEDGHEGVVTMEGKL